MIGCMILYIKRGCPWCMDAEEWLRSHAVQHRTIDVLRDGEAFARMRELSGQSKAPVLVTDDDRVLADFGPEELPGFFKGSVG